MNTEITRLVIVPVDGSRIALKSLGYLHTLYGTKHSLKIALIYIMPALPPILVDEAKRNRKTAKQLKTVEEKNVAMGHRILEESQNYLVHKGFQTDAIDKLCEKKQSGIARDISACIESRLSDALVVSSSGKGRLQGFFMGEVTNKLVEIIRICPVWVVKGDVSHANVLIAVDGSTYSLRSVDHAGMVLCGTQSKIILFHAERSVSRREEWNHHRPQSDTRTFSIDRLLLV